MGRSEDLNEILNHDDHLQEIENGPGCGLIRPEKIFTLGVVREHSLCTKADTRIY